ncbi:MAG: ATP-binding cassette domain-containing protein [Verrucomicrobiales bacterium]
MPLCLESVVWRRPGFSLRVNAVLDGPTCGLSGPSGSGKTTLLELIAGLRRPDHGRIQLGDEVLFDSLTGTRVPPENRGIGYVPQDLALFPHFDVRRNLTFGHRTGGRPKPALDHVTGVLELEKLLARSIHSLSGGEKQRVAIGRALLAGPRLLLVDEPLTGLDEALKQKVFSYLLAVVDEFAVPMLYVTHSRAELDALGGPRFQLHEGQWESCPE